MENKNYFYKLFDTKNSFLAPALIIGAVLLIIAFIVASTITAAANKDQSITVTGTSERVVKSDTAKWTITVNERALGDGAGNAASKQAANGITAVKSFLTKNGIDENEITVEASSLLPICELSPQGYENCNSGIRGQSATQNIVVETTKIDQIQTLTNRLTTEINGVTITNNLVEYYYNALKDIRVDMLSDAVRNAKERANAVAKAGNANVGNITSLSSGVFQVTQKNSVNVDDYGAYDTSSIEKKITATVKVNFSVR